MNGTTLVKLPGHKTKIVCTIGPASCAESVLKKLITGGMDVARINFSHGDIPGHLEIIRRIRSIASRAGRLVTVIADLPGPKIRIGTLQHEPLVIKKGDRVTLTTKPIPRSAAHIPVNYKELPAAVSKNSLIYLNDGFIQMRVQEVSGDEVICNVIIGGHLLSHKGLNLPGAKLAVDPVTRRDLAIIDAALKEGVDTFCISFIEKASAILKVKAFARKRGATVYTIAKIERAVAVENIDEILSATDALMVARGDLGVEIPLENVPGIQKKLIRKANLAGRPVITATQMLESMTDNIRPTRAEATDVANAILDGTDAVMLSEETAIGKYPVETVHMMAKIASAIERQRKGQRSLAEAEHLICGGASRARASVADVISLNVIEAAHLLEIGFIISPTLTGATPRRISSFKPDSWILSFTPNESAYRFLALSYGVFPVLLKKRDTGEHAAILKWVKESGVVKKGDKVILTEGTSSGQTGGTNSLEIITL